MTFFDLRLIIDQVSLAPARAGSFNGEAMLRSLMSLGYFLKFAGFPIFSTTGLKTRCPAESGFVSYDK